MKVKRSKPITEHTHMHTAQRVHCLKLSVLFPRALAAAACGPERELGMLSLKAPSNSPTLSSSNSSTRKKRRRKGGAHGVMTTDDINTASSVELVCKCTLNFSSVTNHTVQLNYLEFYMSDASLIAMCYATLR